MQRHIELDPCEAIVWNGEMKTKQFCHKNDGGANLATQAQSWEEATGTNRNQLKNMFVLRMSVARVDKLSWTQLVKLNCPPPPPPGHPGGGGPKKMGVFLGGGGPTQPRLSHSIQLSLFVLGC